MKRLLLIVLLTLLPLVLGGCKRLRGLPPEGGATGEFGRCIAVSAGRGYSARRN